MAESGLVVQPRLQPCFQAPPTLFKVPPTFCSTAIDCCSCTEGWERLPLYCRQWEVGGALDKATAGSRNWVGLWTRLLQAMEVGGALDKASYCRQQKLGGALDKATAGNGKWVGLWTRLATAGNGSGWGSGQG